jgi:hypothetical protein
MIAKAKKPKKRMNSTSLHKKQWHELTKAEKDYLIKKQTARCDEVFAKYIRARDRFCITCGTYQNLQCSHYYTKRSHSSVRWDERNAHAQCSACHTRHHNIDPGLYAEWMIENTEDYALLKLKAYGRSDYTYDDLVQIELHYYQKLQRLEYERS